ncbi:MAG TPA: extracellular solute-binding protein, partial [Chloroflexota bacterium]|nr:extracellular solute-binding protein [Chloroflexota bacterium]
GDEATAALTQGFQKAYPGIIVDYSALAGDQVGPKVINPVAAGQHLTDLAITGTTTVIEAFMPASAAAPLKDYLVGPNDSDPSKWLNSKYHYADNAGVYNLVFSEYVKAPFVFNPQQASDSDFKSNKNLLDPKWKGKIIMRNPLGPGPGLSVVTYWYTTQSLGKDFVKQFFATNPVMSNNDQQILDGVAHGQYPIGIGPSDVLTNEYVTKGLAVKHMPGEALAEQPYVTAGNGSLAVIKDPPHPNALKLYLDYLLSKDGQVAWVKAAGFASLRNDVPHDQVLDILVPKPGVDYIEQQNEDYVKTRTEIVSFVKPLLPQ